MKIVIQYSVALVSPGEHHCDGGTVSSVTEVVYFTIKLTASKYLGTSMLGERLENNGAQNMPRDLQK